MALRRLAPFSMSAAGITRVCAIWPPVTAWISRDSTVTGPPSVWTTGHVLEHNGVEPAARIDLIGIDDVRGMGADLEGRGGRGGERQ